MPAVLHIVLISVHAVAATGCFVLGVMLLVTPPVERESARLRAFAVLAAAAMVTLLGVVALDWPALPPAKRIAFGVLSGLAAYLLYRVVRALGVDRRHPEGWRRALIGHVGFVLISLFDGFCIVTAIDLRAPPAVTAGVAVLGVAAGVIALRLAIRHDAGRPVVAS